MKKILDSIFVWWFLLNLNLNDRLYNYKIFPRMGQLSMLFVKHLYQFVRRIL